MRVDDPRAGREAGPIQSTKRDDRPIAVDGVPARGRALTSRLSAEIAGHGLKPAASIDRSTCFDTKVIALLARPMNCLKSSAEALDFVALRLSEFRPDRTGLRYPARPPAMRSGPRTDGN